VEVFPTEHVNNEVSLGYNIVEVRHRLKPSLAGLVQEDIIARVRSEGREAVSEDYHQKLFSYGGDSVGIKPAYIADTEVLCHDTTFLDEADRNEYKHATLAEAIACARAARVKKHLYCIHISSRYKTQLKKAEAITGQSEGLDFEITLVPPGRITVVE
jgi:ribonuclease Z